jgi:hypothetical protein
MLRPGSFYVNSEAGDFEDFIIEDVWGFLVGNFPILPDREAHVIAGASMGGFGAFNLAIKHPDIFRVVLGIFPPVNLRWMNCHGRYMANFDPNCWGWRTKIGRRWDVVGRYYGGLVRIRAQRLLVPLFGRGSGALEAVSRENPIEMLDTYDVPPGLFDMFIGYGGRDQFNVDAQVESFLYRARQRGICVSVAYDPRGRHNKRTAVRLFPSSARWLGEELKSFLADFDCALALSGALMLR